MKKALIAMSGGVDSSVTALRMQEAGWECRGITMRLFCGAGETCGSSADVRDAAAAAEKLGIPHEVVDYSEAFRDEVMTPFAAAYERGETPNPCIRCNRTMKFSRLYDEAEKRGCDAVATGHYARVVWDEATGKWKLKKARNLAKDQTYVLYFLTQEQLAHTCFPLGEEPDKEAVRAAAEEGGLLNARKHDSQDICFVPDGDYAGFIRRHTGKDYLPGAFVTPEGTVLGEHKGIIHYTVGQRRGLGLSLPAPLYVKEKRVAENQVVLVPEEELYAASLTAEDFSWVSGEIPQAPFRAWARTRYSAKEAPAQIVPLSDTSVRISFDTPQRAITPGQAVVLYDGDEVLGGGTIRKSK